MSTRAKMLVAASAGLAVAAATVLPAATAVGATGDTKSRGITVPAFYTPPATLPAANGALVRTEPLKIAGSLPGLDGKSMPGTATRLMYKTTDNAGGAATVTGAYIEPSAKWKGTGARPLVVVAPGTQGQGDQCAPSLGLTSPLNLGLTGQTATIVAGYENLAIYRLVSAGIAVALTDYVGLGATDRLHTYVDRVDEGHAVLDAARAARQLPNTSLTPASTVSLFGYSQGGGAVASAAELQPSYAPDVALTGTAAGAPPADLGATMNAIDGSELAGALGWAISGFVQSDPSLTPLLTKYVNAKGMAALKDLQTACVGDAIVAYGYQQSKDWTKNGKPITSIAAVEPSFQATLDKQLIGKLKPTGPVRVATGISDNLVPHAQAKKLASDWCGLGGDVTYAPVDLPSTPSQLVNHFGPLLSDQGDAISWLTDRINGKAATSNCSKIGSMK